MDLLPFVERLHASALAEWIRGTLGAMTVIEAAHVLAISVVFGTILIVDLRLLGYPDTRRSFLRTSNEMLRLTWVAFALAVVTGALLFLPNAITYFGNTAFRVKLLVIVAAGLNMALFQFVTHKSVAKWDQGTQPPTAARVAGLLSILLWITVIVLGRWIGFTKGYDFAIPEDVQFDFS